MHDANGIEYGFDSAGKCIRYPGCVDTAQSRFTEWLIREIREQLLSPAIACQYIARQSQAIRDAFGAIANWATHDDFRSWPCCFAGGSMAEHVRSFGGRYPWLRDEPRWDSLCRESAARRSGSGATILGAPQLGEAEYNRPGEETE